MIKIVLPESFNFDEQIARLVDVHSRGIDSDWMTKRAAAGIFKEFDHLKPEKDHSLIHLIALGDAETFGMNRNYDAFYSTGRQLDLPYPNWDRVLTKKGYAYKGKDTFRDHTDVGNKETVHTFEKFAKVYFSHRNRPHEGHKIYGDVKAAAHNDQMGRVELIIQVPHGKDWNDDLEKMANGIDIPFSMAAKTPADYCSICGHRSTSREEYCNHLQNDMGSIIKSGHVVGAINDHMTYFDISKVAKNADRIALSLVKESSHLFKSAADLAFEPEYADILLRSNLLDCVGPKLAKKAELLSKAADIEKNISLSIAKNKSLPLSIKSKADNGMKEKVASICQNLYSLPSAYEALYSNRVLLPFDKWATLTLGLSKSADMGNTLNEAKPYIKSSFNHLRENINALNNAFDNYATPTSYMRKTASELKGSYGIDNECLVSRAIRNSINPEPMPFLVFEQQNIPESVSGLIKNYTLYKLAFLERLAKDEPDYLDTAILISVLQNYLN